jgi:hypothetical protein
VPVESHRGPLTVPQHVDDIPTVLVFPEPILLDGEFEFEGSEFDVQIRQLSVPNASVADDDVL